MPHADGRAPSPRPEAGFAIHSSFPDSISLAASSHVGKSAFRNQWKQVPPWVHFKAELKCGWNREEKDPR